MCLLKPRLVSPHYAAKDGLGCLLLLPPHTGEMGSQAGTTSSVLRVAGGLTPGIVRAGQTLLSLTPLSLFLEKYVWGL